MDQILSFQHYKHLDTMDYLHDGALILGASCLMSRCWSGALFYFDAKNSDNPQKEHSTAAASVDSSITDVKWLPCTKKFVAACDSGAVQLWELTPEGDTLNCMAQPVAHSDIVSSVSFNADKTKLVSASYDKTVRIWDMTEFAPTTSYIGHADNILCVACHPVFDDIFVTCSQDGRMLLWDTRKPKPASHLETQFLPSLPTCIAWQPGSEHNIAIGTETGHVQLQDSRRGVGIPTIVQSHDSVVHRLAFAPNQSDWLASVSNDCTVAVTKFTGATATVIYKDSVHSDFVQGVAWSPISQKLCTSSWDGHVHCRSVSENEKHERSRVLTNGHDTTELGISMETAVN